MTISTQRRDPRVELNALIQTTREAGAPDRAAQTGLPLQQWMDANWLSEEKKRENETLRYGKGVVDQMCFVRDILHPLLEPNWRAREGRDEPPHYVVGDNPVRVISTHRSKSCDLPVYLLARKRFPYEPGGRGALGWLDDLVIVARGNFHNWTVSVISDVAAPDLFHDLFNREVEVNPIYCEGFRDGWVFGPYADDQKRFTLQLPYYQESMWAFCWLLARGTKS